MQSNAEVPTAQMIGAAGKLPSAITAALQMATERGGGGCRWWRSGAWPATMWTAHLRDAELSLALRHGTRSEFAMAAAALLVGILSAVPNRNPFRFLNQTIGSGPDALRSIVINNEQTGELLQVVHESGGKTAKLMLKDPSYPVVQDVLEPLTDAAAIRDTANGIHYAGSILAPFANRVANGSYTFFGKKYYMPRNECSGSDATRCTLPLQQIARYY